MCPAATGLGSRIVAKLRHPVARGGIPNLLKVEPRRITIALTGRLVTRDMALDQDNDEAANLEAELSRLKQEHRDLDTAIDALERVAAGDQLQVQRLKKRKLVLRDRIQYIEDQITPDIIA